MSAAEVRHIAKTKLFVSINKISELELIVVPVPGQAWSITFVKTPSQITKTNEKTEDVLVVNLNMENDDKSADWACVASLSVKLLRSSDIENAHQFDIGPFVFDAKNKVCGQKTFIKWNELMNAENGYVRNDSCKFEVEIDSGPLQNESTGKCIGFYVNEKCCAKSSMGKFRLTIKDLHELNQLCSPEIHLNNSLWRILVVMKHEQLTVSLWKVDTVTNPVICPKKFITMLKSFNPYVNPVKKVTKTTGIHPSPLELFSIHWKDVIDPQKKYVENGSFVLEIEMKMNAAEELSSDGFDLECPICLRSLMNRSVSATHCGHIFCTECITVHLNKSTGVNQLCPGCQQTSSVRSLRVVYLPSRPTRADPESPTQSVFSSAASSNLASTLRPSMRAFGQTRSLGESTLSGGALHGFSSK